MPQIRKIPAKGPPIVLFLAESVPWVGQARSRLRTRLSWNQAEEWDGSHLLLHLG
jgi:hypothetical protein